MFIGYFKVHPILLVWINVAFFFAFQYLRGGGAAKKIADKIIFPTKKVAKYRWNSLKFALMTFFFAF